MSTIHNFDAFSVLDHPLITEAATVTGWVDAGSLALCDYPIDEAYERVTRAVNVIGFIDTMNEYRDQNNGISQQPAHTSPVVREILSDYHSTVVRAFEADWVKIQTTMRLERMVNTSANSTFHVDGISVCRTDYPFKSAQKIVGITAHPNPTEFLPRGTLIHGGLFEIFAKGNIRKPEQLAADAVTHPGSIALFGYSESSHRKPPVRPEQMGMPRLILRSFITI